jgi:hypothetical protein
MRFLGLAVLLASPAARAEPGPIALDAFATFGGTTAIKSNLESAVDVGIDLRIALGPAIIGAIGDSMIPRLDWTDRHLGVLAGAELVHVAEPNLRVQILGELGKHRYEDLGELVPLTDGAIELTYYGIRGGLLFESRAGASVGLWLSARADRGTQMDIGGREVGVTLAIGWRN